MTSGFPDFSSELQVRESKGSIRVPKDLEIPREAADSAIPVQESRGEEQKEPLSRREVKEDSKEAPDYEQTLSREKHSPLLEEAIHTLEEDLICKEHSLQYQSQTLESQSDHLFHEVITSSLEDLLTTVPESWTREVYEESLDEIERSFKETQYSPKEKRDVQTQTVQESKSTQCSPEQSVTSPCEEPPRISPFHIGQKYFQSPRREVQTQTQGENKSVQCSLDDLGELVRELDQESKSIQCIPEDISTRSSDRSRSSSREDTLRSPRREVEVQTYQESKAVQCSDDELLEADQASAEPPEQARQSRPASSPSSSSSSPRKFPTVVFVEGKGDMTVTHREHDGDVTWSKHWGPERLVEIYREPKTSLGLSIVGGKVQYNLIFYRQRTNLTVDSQIT